MGKRILIQEIAINNTPTPQSPYVISLTGKVVSVAITNMNNSSNELIIGWGESPSPKNYLSQGESRAYGPYPVDRYITGQALRLAFANVAGGALNAGVNQALVIISTETEEEVC
jgi:hypothetical protein